MRWSVHRRRAGDWVACVGTGAVWYRQGVMRLRHRNVKDRGKGTEE